MDSHVRRSSDERDNEKFFTSDLHTRTYDVNADIVAEGGRVNVSFHSAAVSIQSQKLLISRFLTAFLMILTQ